MSSSAMQSQQQSGHQEAPSMMARVDRLDLVVSYLEDMRNANGGSARSSSTLSSSSPVSTPRARCRPAEELLQETRAKGSLVDRIACLENRVLRMEEEERMSFGNRISTAAMEDRAEESGSSSRKKKNKKKKGIKSLVQSCVVKSGAAKLKTKD